MKSIFSSLVIASAALFGNAQAAESPTIVLVHGAFEDASVWGATQAKLRSDGFNVVSVNLPGRPSNPLGPEKTSMDLYRDTVLAAMNAQTKPVILVGHSFGGMTISAVAEAAPEKVKTLVYLAAYLPKEGQSLLSLSGTDKNSKLGPHVQILKDKGVASIEYAVRGELFANDGPDALRKALGDLITDESLGPLATPAHVTAARFGTVDKVYIHTARDMVVSPWLQTEMVKATPVRAEITLDTGHTPFLTAPDALAQAIEALTK